MVITTNLGFRKWARQAGLCEAVINHKGEELPRTTRSQHGIRQRRAKDIAEQNGPIYEVTAYLSHSGPNTVAIYTKRVECTRFAGQAEACVDATRENISVLRPEKLGHLKVIRSTKLGFREISGSP